MNVTIPTQDFPAVLLRAPRFHLGLSGLATRAEARDHFVMYGESLDADLVEALLGEGPRWGDEVGQLPTRRNVASNGEAL